VLFFIVGASSLSIIGAYAYYNAKNALLKRTLDQLTSIRVIKKGQVDSFFNEKFQSIKHLAQDKCLQNIADQLYANDFSNLPDSFSLDAFDEEIDYSQFNKQDLFLIINFTDSILSFFKIHGHGVSSEIPDTVTRKQLLKLYQNARLSDKPIAIDFEKRYVNDTEPQGFIGRKISGSKNNTTSVIAIPVPINEINKLMLEENPENGLGASGEVYLVGSDYLMRSNSRFIPNAVLNIKVNSMGVTNAFMDNAGSSLIDDYRSIACLSSYDKISVPGLNWAIMAEIDYNEAMVPIISLRNDIVFISLIICILLFSIAHFISRTITNPIIRLKNAAILIGEGTPKVNIKAVGSDEIGLLTEAFNTMSDQLDNERLNRMSALYDGQELERQRISRELHDGLGQKLIAIKLQLESTSKQNQENTKATIDNVKSEVLRVIDEVRQISNNLAPNILLEPGFDFALNNLCNTIAKATNTDIEFSACGDYTTTDPKTRFYIYRIAQEALNNAIKHAEPTKIQLQLFGNSDSIILIIEDNGKGFNENADSFKAGNGIFNMRERARLLNGAIHIESEPGSGTTIRLKIPKTHTTP